MDKFYGRIVFETMEQIDNTDNLVLFLNSIEFQKPELLRLDFATIRTSVSKNPDGKCVLTVNCFDFDYDTYKADYERLGLEPDGFTYDYFKSISNDSLRLTDIMAECINKNDEMRQIPLRLKSVRLYFDYHSGDVYLDFEKFATEECRELLLNNSPALDIDVIDHDRALKLLRECLNSIDEYSEGFEIKVKSIMRTGIKKEELKALGFDYMVAFVEDYLEKHNEEV